MGLTLSNAARSAAADALTGQIGAGTLALYSGSRPAGPGTAVTTQTKLAEFPLDDPPFSPAVDGVLTLDVDPALSTAGLAAGTASWFRFADGSDAGVVDGSVTATGDGGDITINSVTVSVGVAVEVTAGTITMPAGTA